MVIKQIPQKGPGSRRKRQNMHSMCAQPAAAGNVMYSNPHRKRQASLKMLLDAGANVNVKDYEGHTPLDYATNFGYHDLANMLAAGRI